LIHSGLMLGRQIFHFTSSDKFLREECADSIALVLYLLIPINSFYQLYILFKYSNVMINRWKQLARFALMHSMATSIFFWFSMILQETMHSLQHKIIQDHSQITDEAVVNLDRCSGGSSFSALILHVSPYLYPFSIEYSIVVGKFAILKAYFVSVTYTTAGGNAVYLQGESQVTTANIITGLIFE